MADEERDLSQKQEEAKTEDKKAEENAVENEGEEVVVDVESRKSLGLDGIMERAEKMVDKLSSLEKKLKESEEQNLRLAAEFDNYKKRTAREMKSLTESANKSLITELLEITDNFKRALESDQSAENVEAVYKGMEMIYGQFDKLLKARGLTEIKAVGKPFDPSYHEAVMTVETDEYPEDFVAREIQKGYMLKDKVLRHAKVAVAKPKQEDNQ
ncbi:MAG: nucleotide exchange factor GrpE [candidate division Zixibacteria bacterium]|nr:nucleotide exchange factor GrpE [candidate division Zixibacteria bacterium]